jgi:hypothetical protein
MSPRSNYVTKATMIYCLVFLDLVINALADHKPIVGGPWWSLLTWIGYVLSPSAAFFAARAARHAGVLSVSWPLVNGHNRFLAPPSRAPISPAHSAQLAVQLLNLILFSMMLFDTYLFQVGLLGVLGTEFKGLLLGLGLHTLVYCAYAGVKVSLSVNQGLSEDALWDSPLFSALSILQKLAALAYYGLLIVYTQKLGLPMWYQRSFWVSKYSGGTPEGR